MTREISISRTIKEEILFDINNGLFSDADMPNCKYYRDKENDLDIEVCAEYKDLIDSWKFDVVIYNDYEDEAFILEEGQWCALHKALLNDIRWREKEAKSEAEFVEYLWTNCA